MVRKFVGDSTFWYFLCRRTWGLVSAQIAESLEVMNRRATEMKMPLVWQANAAVSWATVCRIHLFAVTDAVEMSKWQFIQMRLGASRAMSPREFFFEAFQRIVANVNQPAFPGRSGIDSVADTFALGSASWPGVPNNVDDKVLGVLQAPVIQLVVTDPIIHTAALLAVTSEKGAWESAVSEYSRRRPRWFRRNFTNADTWLFPEDDD